LNGRQKTNSGVPPVAGNYACVSITKTPHRVLGVTVPFPNLLGYAIMLQTWSRYCHCFVYVGDGLIVEAQPGGAAVSPLAKYDGFPLVWSTDRLTVEQRRAIIEAARTCVGKPYGFLDIFAQALVNFGFKNRWLWRQVEREDRLICSQLVSYCGWMASYPAWLCGWDNPAQVTPAQLARRLATRVGNLRRWLHIRTA
jgi:hypothetical protein